MSNKLLAKAAAKHLALLGFYKSSGLWYSRTYPVKIRGCSWWGNVAVMDLHGEHLTAINYKDLNHKALKRLCGKVAGRDCGEDLKGGCRIEE